MHGASKGPGESSLFKGNQSYDLGAGNGVPKFNIGIYMEKTTFSASPLNRLGQCQPNLPGIIIGGWGFKFVQMGPLTPRVLDLGTQKGQNLLFL